MQKTGVINCLFVLSFCVIFSSLPTIPNLCKLLPLFYIHYQLSSTRTFAVPGQPYSVGTYQSQRIPLALLSPRFTPGCRYIQGLQHSSLPTSELEREVACIKANLVQIFRQSFIPCCLSLQNCQGTVSSTRRILVGFAGS